MNILRFHSRLLACFFILEVKSTYPYGRIFLDAFIFLGMPTINILALADGDYELQPVGRVESSD